MALLKLGNVPGFFAQDLNETDPASFDYITSNFGLLESSWGKFRSSIDALNCDAPEGTNYRVLYLARHGQGYHNVAEEYYGTPLWNEYWSKLDGNGTIVWADAKLTDVGIQEAKKANAAWKTQIKAGIPLPNSYYSSPLSRSATTLQITWSDIVLDKKKPPKPLIKEKLRETLGVHTCDRRSSRSHIAETYPNFSIEDGFTEEDELWVPDIRESNEDRYIRLIESLHEIFRNDWSTYITISAHSGAISSILEVIGHRKFQLQTGGIIPVVVKVENVTEGYMYKELH
ncbi:phosphoglycerate mutase-like protein [Wilcoxina mikolae CBS 423.85]|nr:phosphoglycerate mutase-like protein [Wilcoxina mikolae CBS 423.85]